MRSRILVIDDIPTNRRLVKLVLEKDGYEVRTASDGPEALDILLDFRPDLILLDLQMPGMDGLELARRLKSNPATRDIKLVALTAFTREEREREAREAGAEGYLTKPVDIFTLEQEVRRFVGGTAHPAAPAPSVFDLEPFRRTFLETGGRELRRMLDSPEERLDLEQVKRLAHQWAGEGGTFGYPEISLRAKVLELMLNDPNAGGGGLRSRLLDLAALFSASGAEPEIPDEVSSALAGKHIGVLGFDEPMAGRIAALLRSAGAAVSFSPAGEMFVVRIGAPRREVMAWSEMEQPLLLIGSAHEVLDYQSLVRSDGCEFLDANWEPRDLLVRACIALNKTRRPAVAAAAARPKAAAGVPRILLADDDASIVAMLRALLKNYGMECQTASDGVAALEAVRNTPPAAAVLDVNMPGMDGFEVLSAIKNDDRTRDVKVILLTGRQQETDILRGFGLGASDYVVKPFSPMELLARLRRLL